jgi:hypothetical protein
VHKENLIFSDIRLRHIIEIIVIVSVMNVIGTREIDLGMIETGLEMIVTDMLILEGRGLLINSLNHLILHLILH